MRPPEVSRSCSTPEIVSPQLAAKPGFLNRKATLRNKIIVIFITTGVKAAAIKRPCAFKVPDCSVTSVMNKR